MKKENKTSSKNLKSGKFKKEELKLYANLNDKDIAVIMEYQKLLPCLQEDSLTWINARILHEQLGVKTKFNDWIKDRINRYKFEESIDFISFTEKTTNPKGGRPHTKYKLKLDMAKQLCRLERNNPNSSNILKYLYQIDNKIEPIIKEAPRLEYQFGEMLDILTGLKWDRQYPVDNGKYRLDFKLGNTLIVEYDEEQHQYQIEEDENRMKYCIDWLAKNETEDNYKIPHIRVKKGEELEGLHKIILHLVGFEIIYPWNNIGCIGNTYKSGKITI